VNHVDPETLAAWADGNLSSDEATTVESHLADCPQCRAVSAAFARAIDPVREIAPAATAAAGPAASVTKWVLPFAAMLVISAGVAWNLWPHAEVQLERAATQTAAQPGPVPPAAEPPSAPPAAPQVSAASPVRKTPQKSNEPKSEGKPKADSVVVDGIPTASPPDFAAPRRAAVTSVPPPPMPQPVASPPPPPAGPPPPPQVPVVLPPQGAVVGLAQAAPARANANTAISAESVIAADRWKIIEFSSPNPRFNAGGGAGRGGGVRASIATPDQVRWRASGPGTVERSTDGGILWLPVEIEPPAVVLTAGSAPNRTVCWLVGKAGTVLVSKNGSKFERVPFPEPVELVSIIAVSELEATVIAADGRGFVTIDGGKTWRARF
jgi:hypothetical protein